MTNVNDNVKKENPERTVVNATVIAKALNVREKANINSKSLRTLKFGEKVKVDTEYKSDSKWSKISHSEEGTNFVGYCMTKYLKK